MNEAPTDSKTGKDKTVVDRKHNEDEVCLPERASCPALCSPAPLG